MTKPPPTDRGTCDPTIGQLVDGLAEIAGLPIPYARLPRRARALWSAHLRTWADVADLTPASLLAQPRVGEALLTALLEAANEAVCTDRTPATDAATAAQRLLARLSDRDRTILANRLWTPYPTTTENLAKALNISPTAVRRHQARAENRYRELLDDRTHSDLTTHAGALREQLGAVTTDTALHTALSELGLDHDSAAARLLTHLAGPYQPHGRWLENPKGAVAAAETAVHSTLARHQPATTARLVRELRRSGLRAGTAADFLDMCPWARRFGDQWVWWGHTAADRIEAMLRLSREPLSVAELAAQLAEYSEAIIRTTLTDNTRFVRATRHTWALRAWGQEQYAGIFHAIMARVDAAGAIAVVDLVRDMKAAFPDVAERSIRTYAAKPAFVVEDGLLRRRTPQDGWRAVPPLNKARGVFRNGPNEIRVCYRVDRELLRGSGQSVAVAVAAALGVRPGAQRTFLSPNAKVTVAWHVSGSKGPTVGSLRVLAAAVGAQLDDELVLAFHISQGTVTTARISASDGDQRRLTLLLGKPVESARDALARSLGCPPEEVAELLRSRGDVSLAHLVVAPAEL